MVVILLLLLVNDSCGFSFDFGKRYGLDPRRSDDLSQSKIQQIQESARDGRPEGLYLMGLMLFYGHGLALNEKRATEYFKEAAEKGYTEAQFTIGVLLYNGQVVNQNDKAAARWFTRAVENHHPDSQWLLGTYVK